MSYVIRDMAEAQAIGLCVIARQGGLPDISTLRSAVSQFHAEPCGWCDYDRDELLAMLGARMVMAVDESRWWAMPGKARLRAIELAQGRSEVPA